MLTTATRDYLIGGLMGLAVYSAAGLTAQSIPTGARDLVLVPLIFVYTILAYIVSAGADGVDPDAPMSGWQLAMAFVHTNPWLVLTVASAFFSIQVLVDRIGQKWCAHALKTPCTVTGMMAQEVCPNANGPGFVGCVQDEAVKVTKAATTDLRYATDLVTDAFAGIGDALNAARDLFNQIRKGIEAVVGEIGQRLVSAMVPVVQSGLSLKAMVGQLQAVLATVAYLLLSGLMAAKSFIGAFIQVGDTTVGILGGTLAVMLAVMFFAPWMAIPAAVIAGVLAAVAIPLSLVTDMAKGLGISW
jgi:flagellar biosynthesis protein FliQ